MDDRTGGDFGVYVHVPFCARRCDYCAFATWTDRHHLMDAYAEACIAELRGGTLAPATSVFFGGGTPSLLPGATLASILAAIPRVAGGEVTVECNPETVTEALLGEYRRAGVTRLSFGVQSMVPHVLDALGRAHDRGAVHRAVALAGATGYGASYSVDLIYGAVGESLSDWAETMRSVLGLDPPPRHVSAYALTVEAGTALAADARRCPDADDQADKYLLADGMLAEAGLEWYELSNWARPGSECRHNQLYWAQGEYRGIGCAAHSHALLGDGGSRRWWNVRTPERYIQAIAGGRPPESAGETLDPAGRRAEALLLALRTSAGVPEASLADDPVLEGLIARRDGRVVLTPAGRLLANEVGLRLLTG